MRERYTRWIEDAKTLTEEERRGYMKALNEIGFEIGLIAQSLGYKEMILRDMDTHTNKKKRKKKG